MQKKLINKILKAAVMAPSGDNVQPWNLQVSENFTLIELYNLPEKDNSYYNYQQSASYIAHGAVIENIVIAAGHLGCKTKIRLFPDNKNPQLVAQIQLTTAPAQPSPYYEAIFARRTNRFPYQATEITEEALQAIIDSVKNIDTSRVSLVNQKDKINVLAKALMINDQLVFEHKKIHQFLFSKIRWNQQQIEQTRDGMPVGVLGLNFIEKLTFPVLRFWGVVKIANRFGLSRLIAWKAWWNCRNSSLLGLISIQGTDKLAFVSGGRAMQRVWLQLTLQGLAVQPIIGLPLLIHRQKQRALTDFSEKQRQAVKRAAERLPELFKLKKNDTLIMGFRAGTHNQTRLEKTLRQPVIDN